MSSLGGAISLYLGIALAMVFEVIELIIDFFINMIDARKSKNKRGKGSAKSDQVIGVAEYSKPTL